MVELSFANIESVWQSLSIIKRGTPIVTLYDPIKMANKIKFGIPNTNPKFSIVIFWGNLDLVLYMFEYGEFGIKRVRGILKIKKATKFTERDHDHRQSQGCHVSQLYIIN